MGVKNARFIFNSAVDCADLTEYDKMTGRRTLHLHSLRKFFRSYVGLDSDLTHALMGHKGYLDREYKRIPLEEIAKAYKKAMVNVSVYVTEAQKRAIDFAIGELPDAVVDKRIEEIVNKRVEKRLAEINVVMAKLRERGLY